MLRERAKIISIRQAAGSLPHIVFKAGREPVGRREPHVGRTPARVAAGFLFARFFQHRNLDAQAAATRLFGGRERRREAGGAMADDDELSGILVHQVGS